MNICQCNIHHLHIIFWEKITEFIGWLAGFMVHSFVQFVHYFITFSSCIGGFVGSVLFVHFCILIFFFQEKMKGKNKLVPRLLGVTKESILRVDEKTKEVGTHFIMHCYIVFLHLLFPFCCFSFPYHCFSSQQVP